MVHMVGMGMKEIMHPMLKGYGPNFVDTLSGAITGRELDGCWILYVFLPILIFGAGFALDVHTFKKSFINAFCLAGPGIVTATVMCRVLFYGLIQIFKGGVLSEWNTEADCIYLAWRRCFLGPL